MRTYLLIILACCCGLLTAAEGKLEQYRKAMAGNDFQAKRAAIAAVSQLPDDDLAYSLLISAAADRQASQLAIEALRRRSGLQPSLGTGSSPGYPGYPTDDTAGAWGAWNAARLQEKREKAALAEALQVAEEAKRQAEEAQKTAEEGDEENGETDDEEGDEEDGETDDEDEAKAELIDENLGRIDRIFFKDGSILLGHITVFRRDLKGILTSIHVVHQGGQGAEDIDAELISRIEEDIE